MIHSRNMCLWDLFPSEKSIQAVVTCTSQAMCGFFAFLKVCEHDPTSVNMTQIPLPSETHQGLVSMSQCFTSPNYWGYNLQEIFEGDVKQIPKKGHLPTPVLFSEIVG